MGQPCGCCNSSSPNCKDNPWCRFWITSFTFNDDITACDSKNLSRDVFNIIAKSSTNSNSAVLSLGITPEILMNWTISSVPLFCRLPSIGGFVCEYFCDKCKQKPFKECPPSWIDCPPEVPPDWCKTIPIKQPSCNYSSTSPFTKIDISAKLYTYTFIKLESGKEYKMLWSIKKPVETAIIKISGPLIISCKNSYQDKATKCKDKFIPYGSRGFYNPIAELGNIFDSRGKGLSGTETIKVNITGYYAVDLFIEQKTYPYQEYKVDDIPRPGLINICPSYTFKDQSKSPESNEIRFSIDPVMDYEPSCKKPLSSKQYVSRYFYDPPTDIFSLRNINKKEICETNVYSFQGNSTSYSEDIK